jgi:magnesium-transporting ATPase (P-type)
MAKQSSKPVPKKTSKPAQKSTTSRTSKQTRKGKKVIERGTFLSVWLILIAAHSFLAIFLILYLMKQPDAPSRSWLITGLVLLSGAKVISVLALWYWKRWGLYLYLGTIIGLTVIGLLLTGMLLIVFNEFLPLVITGWLLRGKLEYFS